MHVISGLALLHMIGIYTNPDREALVHGIADFDRTILIASVESCGVQSLESCVVKA